MPAFATPRGRMIDWATQHWVRATGRAVTRSEFPWLEGPAGDVNLIGTDFFHRHAERRGWTVVEAGEPRGLLQRIEAVEGPTCQARQVDLAVTQFYERTSEYEFDVWSKWSSLVKPFGGLLGAMFSKRL